jgi:glycosyltransferase involved in cell wall biosynthesis
LLAVCRPEAIGGQAACARMLMQHMDDVEWVVRSFPLPRQYGGFMRFFSSVTILLESLWICMTGRIDAVHMLTACGRNALFEKLIIARVLKLTGVRVLINFQGAFDHYYSGFSKSDQRFVKKSLQKLDVILCLHAGMKNYLTENGIVAADRIRVIPNGVTIEDRLPGERNNDKEVRLLYLGWLVRNKGLLTLVGAMGILQNKFWAKNYSLTVTGPEEEAGLTRLLMAEAEREEVAQLIRFSAPVFGDEKKKVLASTDIFVFPTRMEGLPFVLLEAMQAGLAVVTTDISPMNLIVEHGVNGLLFEKDNAADLAKQIHILMQDEKERGRLGRAARQHVISNYSVEQVIMKYRQLYSEF